MTGLMSRVTRDDVTNGKEVVRIPGVRVASRLTFVALPKVSIGHLELTCSSSSLQPLTPL